MKTMLPVDLMKTIILLLMWATLSLHVMGSTSFNNNDELSTFGQGRSDSGWLRKQFRSRGRVLKKNMRHLDDGKTKREISTTCNTAATSSHQATDTSMVSDSETSIRKHHLPRDNTKGKRWWRNSIKHTKRIQRRRAKLENMQRKPLIGDPRPLSESSDGEEDEELYKTFLARTGHHYDLRANDIDETSPKREILKIVFFPSQVTDVSGWPHKRNRILRFTNFSLDIPASEREDSQLEIESAKLNLAIRTTKSNDNFNKVRIRVHIRHLEKRVLLSYDKKILTDRPEVVHLNLSVPLVKEIIKPSPSHQQTIVLKVTCKWQGNRKCEFIGQADKYQSISGKTIHKHDGPLTKKQTTLRKPRLEFTFVNKLK